MTTTGSHGRPVNVEPGKQGFQETAHSAPAVAVIEEAAVTADSLLAAYPDSQTLRMLLDKDGASNRGEDLDDIAVELAGSSSYDSFDFAYEVRRVGDMLNGYSHSADLPTFYFEYTSDGETRDGGYNVQAAFEHDELGTVILNESAEEKQSTYDRSATGVEQAIATADALWDTYQRLLKQGQALGLYTPDA